MKTDGMHRVRAPVDSTMKTGLAGFQAVYPRASHVARSPPDGKLDASGSLWINCSPVNDSMGWRSSSNDRNASCFSAVRPVCGWNQCVKCVTPREIAHSLITWATVGAMSWSSFFPWRIEDRSLAYTSRGNLARICLTPNVLTPKYSDVGGCAGGVLPFVRAPSCTGRSVMSLRIALRVMVDGIGRPGWRVAMWPGARDSRGASAP